MKRTKQIADRFREVILNGKWIANTNFKVQLSDVNWQQATTKVGTLNTIAALAFHVNYYIAGVLNVLEGGSLYIRDKYSFDLPPIVGAKDWDNLRQMMWGNAEKFATLVEQMPDEKLEDVFVEEKYGSYLRNIEGIIEHAYYHLGQVGLIKKMLENVEL